MRKIGAWVLVLTLFGVGLSETIYEVQYNETTQGSEEDCYPSPYYEQEVTVTGVVTAKMTGAYPDFWLQEKTGTLWSGVFFYDSSVDPTIGDSLTLTAEVDEYYGLTELKYVSNIITHGTAALPEITDIYTADLAGGCNNLSEQYEGMLVRVSNVVVTAESNSYNEWYVMDQSGESCQIDDQVYEHSYEPQIGDSIAEIIGVVQYSHSEYEIDPRMEEDLVGIQEFSAGRAGGRNALHAVSPNPAMGFTEIAYEMKRADEVSIKLYDASGRLVRNLFDGQAGQGTQSFVWNAGDLDAGVYFVSMRTEGFEATRPLIVAR
jgi:hypothetical protein